MARPVDRYWNWPRDPTVVEERYRKFVVPILPDLQRIARRYAGKDSHFADDLVAEASHNIIMAVPSFDASRDPRAYFITIGANKMLDLIRKKKRKSSREMPLLEDIDSVDFFPGKSKRPDELLERLTKGEILLALDRLAGPAGLTEKQIVAVKMRALNPTGKEGSYAAIAKALGIPLGTAKSTLYNARKRLIAALKGRTQKPRGAKVRRKPFRRPV